MEKEIGEKESTRERWKKEFSGVAEIFKRKSNGNVIDNLCQIIVCFSL